MGKVGSNRLVFNLDDLFNTSNIGGFNISNFTIEYLNNYVDEVIEDYEKSFIGTFLTLLLT